MCSSIVLPQTQGQAILYLASPISTYRTRRYARNLAAVRRHFADHAILPARGLFPSSAAWRRRWPELRAQLSELVFFDDGAGWIGRGAWVEIHDMQRLGRPVWYLSDDGNVWPLEEMRIEPAPNCHDWVRFARVVGPRTEER